jgi:hypothetical protein
LVEVIKMAKQNLNERLERIVNKYHDNPKKLRKELKLFARITNLSEEQLKNYIEKQRELRNKGKKVDTYSGLAQSVLYTIVKNKTGDWKEAYRAVGSFDLPYGGAFITADQDNELNHAKFYGDHAGYGLKATGKEVLAYSSFMGNFAGAYAELEGEFAGKNASFKGNYSGENTLFKGFGAGWGVSFEGENAGTNTKFIGKYSGANTLFRGRNAGAFVVMKGDYAGRNAYFKGVLAAKGLYLEGKKAGKEIKIEGVPMLYGMTFKGEKAGEGMKIIKKY